MEVIPCSPTRLPTVRSGAPRRAPSPSRWTPISSPPRARSAPSTQRAVKADLEVYAAWCGARGIAALPAVPADGGRVRRRHGGDTGAGHRAPLRRQPRRRARCAGAPQHGARSRRAPRAQAHAPPPRAASEAGLGAHLGPAPTPAGGRRRPPDRTRATGRLWRWRTTRWLRRSELSELQVTDLVEEIRGDATLMVRRGKTDPEGRGAAVYLARDTVALVREWQERSGIESGRLFRSVSKGGAVGTGLHPSQIPRIVKQMAPPRRPAGRGRGGAVRAQRAGGRGAGYGGERHRAAGDPAGWALEDDGDGEPLRGAPARPPQRRGAARPPSGTRLAVAEPRRPRSRRRGALPSPRTGSGRVGRTQGYREQARAAGRPHAG